MEETDSKFFNELLIRFDELDKENLLYMKDKDFYNYLNTKLLTLIKDPK